MPGVAGTTAEYPPIHSGADGDMTEGAIHRLTLLIDRPYGVAVADKPTRRAVVVPPLGFVVLATVGTRPGAVCFALPFEDDSLGCEFVDEKGDLPPMRPLAELLLTIPVHAFTASDIAQIAHHESPCPLRHGVISDRPRDLMFDVAPLAVVPCQQVRLAPLQLLPPTRVLRMACLTSLKARESLVSVLVERPKVAGGEDNYVTGLICHGGRVNLPEVGGKGLTLSTERNFNAIVHYQMPLVAASNPVIHQPNLDKGILGKHTQIGGQSHHNRVESTGSSQSQFATLYLDARRFPDRRAIELPLVWVFGSITSVNFRRFARFVKGLLSRVAAVGMKRGRTKGVIQPLSCTGREPVTSAPIDAVVPHEHFVVDPPALAVQGIRLGAGKVAIQDVCANHWLEIFERLFCLMHSIPHWDARCKSTSLERNSRHYTQATASSGKLAHAAL